MNRVIEAANKNLKKIIQKILVAYIDWYGMFPCTLYAYC